MAKRGFGDVLDEAERLKSSVPAWTPLLERVLERDRMLLEDHQEQVDLMAHADVEVAARSRAKAGVLDGQVSLAWAMWQQLIDDWGMLE